MLTTEQMTWIVTDTLLGREQSVVGPEADRFRESLTRDIAEAKRLGYTISIPAEWEVDVKTEPNMETEPRGPQPQA
jgi:hypothetical protein